MGDWADERAAEWFGSITPAIPAEIRGRFVTLNMPSLAALLREQKAGYSNAEMGNAELAAMARADVLAEVRRVVLEVVSSAQQNAPNNMRWWNEHSHGIIWCRDEILSRLDKL